MGNTAQPAIEKQTDVGTDKELLQSLNITLPSDTEDATKYLDDYLTKLSDTDLNNLLLQWGVPNDTISKLTTQTDKIACVKKVCSPDYWRINAELHVNYKRVKMWLKVHSNYRGYLTEILNESKKLKENDNNTALIESIEKLFTKFETKLVRHTDFEENYLFKFFSDLNGSETYKGLKCLNLDTMHEQHAHSDCYNKIDHETADANNNSKNEKDEKTSENDNGNDKSDGSWPSSTKDIKAAFAGDKDKIAKLGENIEVYCDEMMNHLLLEERSIVHVWLNLSAEEQNQFNSSLTFVYWVAYAK